MPRYQHTGLLGVIWAPAVANIAAPTAAEGAAGTKLSAYLVRNGLKTPATGSVIDASDVSSLFNSTAPGTYGGDAAELTCHRGSIKAGTDDVAWTTLARGSIGFLIVGRSGFAQPTNGLGNPIGTLTAADRVEVYPVTVISRAMLDIADNETARFTAMLAITSTPNDNAVAA